MASDPIDFLCRNRGMLPCLTDTDAIARRLRANQIGLIPTDTLWGIGGLAMPEIALRIQGVKHRAMPKPLIVLTHSLTALGHWIAPLTAQQQAYCDAHWPGPVTLLLPAGPEAPSAITAGRVAIGVRIPQHELLRQLLSVLPLPLISTSANLAGMPAARVFSDIGPDIQQYMDFWVDWAEPVGRASSIFDLTQWPPLCIRGK